MYFAREELNASPPLITDWVTYQIVRPIRCRRICKSKMSIRSFPTNGLLPGILGLLHILIGMRIFTFVLEDSYYRLWFSLLIFLAIYGGYCFFTVYFYRKIVLPKH